MKRRLTVSLLLIAALAALCLTALAQESELAITSASGYEDGFVLTVSGLDRGETDGIPSSLALLYAPKPSGDAEATDLTSIEGFVRVIVPLPLENQEGFAVSGFPLAPGGVYAVQVEAAYGSEPTMVLSDVVLVEAVQGLIPTAPESIAFANKTEAVFEGQTLALSMSITPLSSGKTYLAFSSSNKKVATVDEKGVVTGVLKGKVTITASGVNAAGKTIKATVTVTVNRAVTNIALNKTETLLAVGKRFLLKATVTPTSASSRAVTYASDHEDIATVDKNGYVKGISAGECTITVFSKSNPEVTAACKVTVIIPVSKMKLDAGERKVYVGQALPLTVTYTPEGASIQAATFKSGATKYLTVDESGIVTGVARGSATVTATATDGSGTKTAIKITVLQQPTAIAFKNPPAIVYVGTDQKLTAVVSPSNTNDKSLLWSTSDESIATVNKNGVVTPLYPGQVTITATATDFPEVSASCTLTVNQPVEEIVLSETKLNILVNTTAQLTYEILPDYTTDKSIVWLSSKPSVASVDENGLVTAHKRGTATITVSSKDGSKKTAKATVNVIQPLYGMALDKMEFRVGRGNTATLTAVLDPKDASNTKVTWSSSNSNIARVSGSSITATVTGIAWGDAVITAVTDEGGYTDKATVHVGDYDKALDIVALILVPQTGGGYKPFFQIRNLSNMEITHVSFMIKGYGLDGYALYMGSGHPYVYGEYVDTLSPGQFSEESGFYYATPGNYDGIERVEVAIRSYTTSDGVEWDVFLTDSSWWAYSTPEYIANHPEE